MQLILRLLHVHFRLDYSQRTMAPFLFFWIFGADEAIASTELPRSLLTALAIDKYHQVHHRKHVHID